MPRTRNAAPTVSLVDTPNFIRAIRDSGYPSMAAALAELVDNSLQAGASQIDIELTSGTAGAGPTVMITDNGHGMSPKTLALCLLFGGSTRFGDRASLGRFGMGLPAASLSQTKEVSVVSWTSQRRVMSVRLAVDECVAGDLSGLTPRATARTDGVTSPSGCIVIWHGCDRVEYKRLGWLERSLSASLGQLFRSFIANGARISINHHAVKQRDPLMRDQPLLGQVARDPFGLRTIQFQWEGITFPIEIRFGLFPVETWHQMDNTQKRRLGITRGAGVSVLRANREIAYGWHFMGDKRRENYDDWWRCEISVPAGLDEVFGITHTKQGIRPKPSMDEALTLEIEPLARTLTGMVRDAFERIRLDEVSTPACRAAEMAERTLPPLQRGRATSGRVCRLKYSFVASPLGDAPLVSYQLAEGRFEVRLNSDHGAYNPMFCAPRNEENSDSALRLALIALARVQAEGGSRVLDQSRDWALEWSRTLSEMVRFL